MSCFGPDLSFEGFSSSSSWAALACASHGMQRASFAWPLNTPKARHWNRYFQNCKFKWCSTAPEKVVFSSPTFILHSVCGYFNYSVFSLLALITSRCLFQGVCHLVSKAEPSFPRKSQIFPTFICLSISSVYSLHCSLLYVVVYFLLPLPKSLPEVNLALNKCFLEDLYGSYWSRNVYIGEKWLLF